MRCARARAGRSLPVRDGLFDPATKVIFCQRWSLQAIRRQSTCKHSETALWMQAYRPAALTSEIQSAIAEMIKV